MDPSQYLGDPDLFYRDLPQLDPKGVRLFLYRLGTLDRLKFNSPPAFLAHLDQFPAETLLVILKYKFPTIIDGDLFFIRTPQISDFALDLCNVLEVDLNHLNLSTGETILHSAIKDWDLAKVQKILSHGVDPNVESEEGLTPLQLSIGLYKGKKDPRMLLIIRHLRRYGATAPYSNNNSDIQRELLTGEKLTPLYYTSQVNRALLDRTEDLALILTDQPELLQSGLLQKSIQRERAQSKQGYGWPLFINDTLDPDLICPIEKDDRITSSSPPDNVEVYRKALATMVQKQPEAPYSPPPPNTLPPQMEGWLPQINFEFSQLTKPLPTAPIMPTGNPKPALFPF